MKVIKKGPLEYTLTSSLLGTMEADMNNEGNGKLVGIVTVCLIVQ